jgi:hypothetical protein
VIFYLPPSDRVYGWDYPYLRDELSRAGVASTVVRTDVLDAEGRQAAVHAVEEFVTELGRAHAQG